MGSRGWVLGGFWVGFGFVGVADVGAFPIFGYIWLHGFCVCWCSDDFDMFSKVF